jgi:hypothetical protein
MSYWGRWKAEGTTAQTETTFVEEPQAVIQKEILQGRTTGSTVPELSRALCKGEENGNGMRMHGNTFTTSRSSRAWK